MRAKQIAPNRELHRSLPRVCGGRVLVAFCASAVVSVSVACGSSRGFDTLAAIEACVERHTPAIRDPLFRRRTHHYVRTFCAFAAGERDVLAQNGSVPKADEKRILRSHPEVVSSICAAGIGFRRLPTDAETLRQRIRIMEAEHRKVCGLFLQRLR
jgi:hypothetical protein